MTNGRLPSPPVLDGHVETSADRIACLEHALRQRNLLMATLGHDLKQPLQIILRAIERLSCERPPPTECLWADAAIDQIYRISDGLTQLATVAMLGEADQSPKIQTLRLGDIFADLERHWALPARESGADLRFVHSSALVRTDHGLLVTVLGNLIGNAVKHGRGAPILVGARRRGAKVTVLVADRGPGMPHDLQRRVFTAGVRGATEAEGMGLGLALVSQIAEELGHPLAFESGLGSGTRFALTLNRAA